MLLVAFAASIAPMTANAQGRYPQPVDPYINDYAKLLTTEDAANIRTLFTDLKRDAGIEAVVVTINSVNDYPTGDKTIKAFATNLFNTWGIGDRAHNNGVLILVAVADREMRIELGSGYGSAFNAAMQEVINEHMLPSFRRNEYSQGIYRGARAVIGKLTGVWPPDLSQPSDVSSAQARPGASSASSDLGLALAFCGVTAAISAAAFGLIRYNRRRCPNCKTRLIKLDEASDDMYLDSGQKLEELLYTVDYEVWKCPDCGTHTLHPHHRRLRSFQSCPRCGYRTLEVTKKTLRRSSYSRRGKERITRHCRHCQFQDKETVVVPMLIRSDDHSSSSDWNSGFSDWDSGSFDRDTSSSGSASSSFGGGQSSGDGASGKW